MESKSSNQSNQVRKPGVEKPIIVALDYASQKQALEMAAQLDPTLCRVKVGKELFTYAGPSVVTELKKIGFDVFLDLKFHDIPNTTANAVLAAAELGVWMVNVHASGGKKMMATCVDKLSKVSSPPLLIGVTVLTSTSDDELVDIGLDGSALNQVERLAGLCSESGMNGVVCSAHEAALLRAKFGTDFTLVTPGIRPSFAQANDQKRIMTPSEALSAGSDYLVIGRPITQAENPLDALERVMQEIAS